MSHSPLQLQYPASPVSLSAPDSPRPTKSRPVSLQSTSKSSRRQSSIGYFPPDSERYWHITPASPSSSEARVPALHRSVSFSGSPRTKLKDARRKSYDPRTPAPPTAPERERPNQPAALTLAEKHADLLHFIAQKESKCLELRSQLASHESELLQLKQKWERIVNRDFGKALSSAYSASPTSATTSSFSTSTNATSESNNTNGGNGSSSGKNGPSSTSLPGHNGAVFDGLVEGMQMQGTNLGRLLAAAATGLSSPTSSSSPPHSTFSSLPHPSPASRAHARSSSSARSSTLGRRGISNGHASNLSNSSTSTAATGISSFSMGGATGGGNRLSLSSASSLGVGDEPVLESHKEESSDVEEGRGVQELMVRDTGATPTLSPNPSFVRHNSSPSSPSTSTSLASSKLVRRKSREVSPLVSLDEPQHDREPEPDMKSQDVKMPPKTKKRTSLNGTGAGVVPATPTSIPGIGSLSAIGAQSWVGSVGKKIEDLQSGKTFAKGSKRASVLLSDVFAALSSPSPSSSAFSIVSPSTPDHTHTPSSLSAPSPAIRRAQSSSSTSLMDDDDDTLNSLGTVLKPDSKVPLTPTKPMKPVRAATAPNLRQQKVQDDDDEWNW